MIPDIRDAIRYAFLAAAALSAAGCSNGTEPAPPDSEPEAAGTSAPAFDYSKYDALLAKYVDAEGYVDYKGLKAARADLDAFVTSLGTLSRTTYDGWATPDRIAMWINAYNAITLQYILNHYPIQKGGVLSGLRYPANSIRQIDGVWDTLTSPVMGVDYVLEDIEDEVLRKQFDEPRLHVAIVCASIGCPPLRSEAFTGDKLDKQLDAQSATFMADPAKFRIDRSEDVVYLSSIFKWFGKDFIQVYGTDAHYADKSAAQRAVLNFVSGYVSDADARYLAEAVYTIEYLDYDWSLNER